MGLTSSGLGSGMNIDDLVSKLMNVETRPLLQLQQKQKTYQDKISALGQIKGGLSTFQTALKNLQDPTKYQTLSGSTSDKDVAEISAGSKAPVGAFSLKVETLAASQKLATATFVSSKTPVNGATEETLTFSFGTTSGSTFTPQSGTLSKQVKIAPNATLEEIRDSVNKANIGVSASIVNDGSGYRLIYSSAKTGAENTLKITAEGGAGSALAGLTHDPAGSKLTTMQDAKDAVFYIDGLKIVKPSNTVSDAIEGVTLTLKKAQDADDAALRMNVSRDTSGVKKTLDEFVKSYNDLNKMLKEATAATPGTKPGESGTAAPLNGITAIRNIQSQLRVAFGAVTDNGGTFKFASQLGLTFSKDGQLSLDSTKLNKAIDEAPDDVARFFATGATIEGSGFSFSTSTANTKAGTYEVAVDAVVNGYNFAGSTPSSLTGGQSFAVKVDGVTVNATLPAGPFNSATALAKALESTINGDAGLAAAKGKVSVTVDDATGKLLMTSTKSGEESKVEVLSGLEFAGFTPGAGVAGSKNVSGTIGGYPARGDGNKLVGAVGTPVEGLTIEITGGTVGDKGKLTYTQGFSFQLGKTVESMLADNGPLTAFDKGLNASLKDLQKQQDRLSKSLQVTEARYRAQFNAMDRLLSQLNSTSSFLNQQIAGLQKSGS
ncbi:Flagellar capping protein FliD [Gulbenkiania indica]|uniref:Flagellar hook-associated protein 2 n=1 Tax=Gulbenkiania indica TaxID=375574 RepID=A0A0K6H2R5_9NEIS|nr:flagellar filament capping protein FliD [Gulbenkiania indica]CUA85273.1 Flagellar capping protein FliD [Gulbenkiania indica]